MTVDTHSLNKSQTIKGHTIEPTSCNINCLYLMNSLLCFVKNTIMAKKLSLQDVSS